MVSYHCDVRETAAILIIPDLSLQCFGWLGLNGAGKSTTFKLLTGQLAPTAGSFEFLHPGTRMGYCPQNNALDPNLSVSAMLKIYSALLGIPRLRIPEVIHMVLEEPSRAKV